MHQAFGGSRNNSFSRAGKQRIVLLCGSSVVLAMTVLAVTLIYSESNVDAKQVNKEIAREEGFLGTVKLYAPRAQVERGSKIESADLMEVHWPSDQVPQGAIRTQYDVQDMYASAVLAEGQPIVKSNLSPTPLIDSIAERLPRGYRAITIEVDATSGIEGWARPGAHVDVQLTYFDREEAVNKARIVVEDAIVLSFSGNSKVPQHETNQKRLVGHSNSTTATLAVSVKDSLAIQAARATGRITLALRNQSDALSQGELVFDPSEEWDNTRDKTTKQNNATRGFAKFSGTNGEQKSLVLGDDGKWWQNEDGE